MEAVLPLPSSSGADRFGSLIRTDTLLNSWLGGFQKKTPHTLPGRAGSQ